MYEVKPISCEMPIFLKLSASKCFYETETFFGHEEYRIITVFCPSSAQF